MEAIEELPPVNSLGEVVKEAAVSGDPSAELDSSKTNGIPDATTLLESAGAEYPVGSVAVSEAETLQSVQSLLQHDMFVANDASATAQPDAPLAPEAELFAAMETSAAVEHLLGASKASEEANEEVVAAVVAEQTLVAAVNAEQTSVAAVDAEQTSVETEHPEADHSRRILVEATTLEIVTDNVTFTTEIVVEKSDELSETETNVHDHTNNILNELGHGMDLSEALRSSDNADVVENNNCSGGEEVFNKEELLDILEGNNDEAASQFVTDQVEEKPRDREKAKELALNQLSRLKSKRSKKLSSTKIIKKSPKETTVRKRRNKKDSSTSKEADISTPVNEINAKDNCVSENSELAASSEENRENNSIVNKLVQDWDDDDTTEIGNPEKVLDDLIKLEDLEVTQGEGELEQDMADTTMDINTANSTNTAANMKEGANEAQPQRRHSRVIKKKIPFDPDNPPTFTKKVAKKEIKEKDQNETPPKKEPKEKDQNQTPTKEKEQTLTKKIKTDSDQNQRAKSKSPIRKMQWKKPPPKNGNTTKHRLTEVDKLLMDEGAVNMIYQLTPEAPKGRNNMRTKAAFIKKVQSSTPEGKEMKFRERKKEVKSEEGEAKKIAGSKQRSSINSSRKSPAALDDFETHSADDSIIYRRHSSSSYSDCMSPRRLSEVESTAVQAAVQAAARASRQASATQSAQQDSTEQATSTEVFMDEATPAGTEIINKDDCRSIKDKLNKKLSQALNKRKRETTKTEKLTKQKKLSKDAEVKTEKTDTFRYVSVTFDQRLAEICIRKTGPTDGILVFKELEQALKTVDSMKDISVTLLTSECGGLSAKVDLTPLLDTNIERRMNYAYEVAESIRRVLSCAATHSKLLVSGAWGACGGVALALLVLSDAALAADGARFCAVAVPPSPGLAALTAGPMPLPPALVNELLVCGRWMSTAEAAAAGLVTRVWPGDAAAAAVRHAAAGIAKQPPQSIQLKKQLLSLRKTSEAMSTFQASLERERDLLVEYWTSVEGQDIIRASISAE